MGRQIHEDGHVPAVHGRSERPDRGVLFAPLRNREILGTQRAGGYSDSPLWQTQRERYDQFGRRPINSTNSTPATSGRTAIPPVFRLDGRVALITGAGRGIGAEGALALAGAGAE